MSWVQVIVLAILQGLTEFLPVSSSGHLAIASRVFFTEDAGASFTAVTQLGTEVAVLVYFARDIGRILKAWFNGLFVAAHRTADYWLGWWVIIGTHPDRRVRPVVQGRNPNGRTQSVVDRDRVDRVLGGHRRGGVLRPPDTPSRTAHVEGQHHRRPRTVPGAGTGCVEIRCDDQRRAVPRDGPRTRRAVRLPARDPGGVRIGAVLAARRVSSGRRGDERQRSAVVGGDRDRLLRRIRGRRLVPAISGAAQHVLVRRLPRRCSAPSC